MSFEGKVAFITGGAAGIGAAAAEAFVARGAAVAIADLDADAGRMLAAKLSDAGGRAIAIACDVADQPAIVAAVAETSDAFGGVDFLINNAGRHLHEHSRPFVEQSTETIFQIFNVNVMGAIYCTLACRETMRARGGGAIVNISSIGSNPSMSPYGVSKLAVEGLTTAFAGDLAEDGTRVNAIAPGMIATEALRHDKSFDHMDEFVNRLQRIRRLGTEADVVPTILFLCSSDASFITGEVIRVSGGYPYHR